MKKDLFVSGEFKSHSGMKLSFKIECDALSDESLQTLAREFVAVFPIREMHAIPRGGTRFAKALRQLGVVIFARRSECPSWVIPMFTLNSIFVDPR